MSERRVRRFASSASAAAAAFSFAVAGAGAETVAPAPAPLRMVVLGDSLAVGTGASDPTNGLAFRVYRSLLAARPGTEVTNHAIGGSRVADVTRLQLAELGPDRADLILVIIGGNDVVRETKTARFASDALALFAGIRRAAPRAVVVACGVPDVARSPLFSDTKTKTETLARVDDAALRRAAGRYGATFVDLFRFTRTHATDPEFFSSDDFHPSDAGYAQLAAFAIPIVEAALRAPR